MKATEERNQMRMRDGYMRIDAPEQVPIVLRKLPPIHQWRSRCLIPNKYIYPNIPVVTMCRTLHRSPTMFSSPRLFLSGCSTIGMLSP